MKFDLGGLVKEKYIISNLFVHCLHPYHLYPVYV